MRTWLRFFSLLILFVLLVGCSPRRGYEAFLLLRDAAAGEEPSRLKQKTPEPERLKLRFPFSGGFLGGDLYLPGEESLAGILLVPGAAEEGKDDPRLMAFARSLARTHFVVLVPDLESIRMLEIRGENADEIADAFRWFQLRRDLVPSERFGMMAFSYAVGPTVIAAKQPQLADEVDYIVGVGGYYDLRAVLTFFTTGWFHDGEAWQKGDPNRYGKWIFIEGNVHRLADVGDQERLQAMAERRQQDLDAPIADLAEGLTPEGESLYRFIVNEDREKALELIAGLPEFLKRETQALDLADKDLRELKARLILIHGLDDPIIPHTESLKLQQALPPEQVELYLVRGLMHVDITPGLIGSWRMWRAVLELLRERDGVR
jgi:pimeloyl-ACP methyl ester carboxylesterase